MLTRHETNGGGIPVKINKKKVDIEKHLCEYQSRACNGFARTAALNLAPQPFRPWQHCHACACNLFFCASRFIRSCERVTGLIGLLVRRALTHMNTTTEKNIRAAAIICHLNAMTNFLPRPVIHSMENLAQANAETLLAELEALLEGLYPNNDTCVAVVGDLRAKL